MWSKERNMKSKIIGFDMKEKLPQFYEQIKKMNWRILEFCGGIFSMVFSFYLFDN